MFKDLVVDVLRITFSIVVYRELGDLSEGSTLLSTKNQV